MAVRRKLSVKSVGRDRGVVIAASRVREGPRRPHLKLRFVTQSSDSTTQIDETAVLEFNFETWFAIRLTANRMSVDDSDAKFVVGELSSR